MLGAGGEDTKASNGGVSQQGCKSDVELMQAFLHGLLAGKDQKASEAWEFFLPISK